MYKIIENQDNITAANFNANGVELMYEGYNPFADNGQGALQNFTSPFWTKYIEIPFCGTYCIPTVVGCLDPTAYNYNEEANTDDGSCEPIVEGCTNDLAFNYNPEANVDDDSWHCLPRQSKLRVHLHVSP